MSVRTQSALVSDLLRFLHNIELDIENKDDITQISFGNADQVSDSENTGNIKIDSQEEKSHLQQSKLLKMVLDALNYLKDEKVNISDAGATISIEKIYFVDEECALNEQQMTTQFFRVLKKAKKKDFAKNLWLQKRKIMENKIEFLGYRNYLLIKIVLTDNRNIYLFEIDRKDSNESFLGMIFNLIGNIDTYFLSEILNEVMLKQGILNKVEIATLKKMTFKHAIKNDTLNENMKNTLRRVMRQGLFSSI